MRYYHLFHLSCTTYANAIYCTNRIHLIQELEWTIKLIHLLRFIHPTPTFLSTYSYSAKARDQTHLLPSRCLSLTQLLFLPSHSRAAFSKSDRFSQVSSQSRISALSDFGILLYNLFESTTYFSDKLFQFNFTGKQYNFNFQSRY